MSCLVRLEKQCCFHRDYHFCPVFAADWSINLSKAEGRDVKCRAVMSVVVCLLILFSFFYIQFWLTIFISKSPSKIPICGHFQGRQ
jgi:hypothetical protein